jgi:hypothetical protein
MGGGSWDGSQVNLIDALVTAKSLARSNHGSKMLPVFPSPHISSLSLRPRVVTSQGALLSSLTSRLWRLCPQRRPSWGPQILCAATCDILGSSWELAKEIGSMLS